MPQSQQLTTLQKVVLTALMAVVLWLPRGLTLDRFVAVDERSWLTRSGNFYQALSEGDFANTFQRYHPGVTTMWLGMAGYLVRYPAYAADATEQIRDMSAGVEDFLREQDHEPMELLAAGRTFVTIAIVASLLLAFWITAHLIGLLPAIVSFLLLAFEPFLLGLSRMLHVDGLSSVFMFVSLLAMLRYYAGAPHDRPAYAGRVRDVVISGVAAGLAWLSKSPSLFLIPFIGLVILHAVWARWRAGRSKGEVEWRNVLRPMADGVVWLLVGTAVFMALWPSMWVQPKVSLRAIFAAAGDSAAVGHSKELFYNGRIYTGDPGFWFYTHTYLWRASPVTLIGLALGVGAWLWKRAPLTERTGRQTVAWLALFALLFTLVMTLGAKKFPRYMLPAYMPLGLIAGVGWSAVALWAGGLLRRRWVVPLVAGVPLVVQVLITLPTFPYYFTYYNPMLGGAKRAPEVLTIGLGEGLDEAARYLAELPDAEQNTVAAWYRGGSFNYVYPYESVDIQDFHLADYAVIYAHQWQREVPDKRLLDYFSSLSPERIVEVDGTEYARVYDLREAAPPSYFTDWARAIRLVGHEVIGEPVVAGEPFVVRLHLQSIARLEENLSVLVRAVDSAGNELARSEGWPYGSPTSTWQPGEVYVDGHELTLPADTQPGYARIEAAVYDPDTQKMLTPTVAADERPLPDMVALDYVEVGLAASPKETLTQVVELGEQITLVGAELDGEPVTELGAGVGACPAGGSSPLTLYWRMRQYTPVDYTVLLQLIGPDGQLAGQWDSPPTGGLLPTSLWRSGGSVVDDHTLALPQALAPGEYRLIAGLYDIETMERLPVRVDGDLAGDSVLVGTCTVKAEG